MIKNNTSKKPIELNEDEAPTMKQKQESLWMYNNRFDQVYVKTLKFRFDRFIHDFEKLKDERVLVILFFLNIYFERKILIIGLQSNEKRLEIGKRSNRHLK